MIFLNLCHSSNHPQKNVNMMKYIDNEPNNRFTTLSCRLNCLIKLVALRLRLRSTRVQLMVVAEVTISIKFVTILNI
jgi:hypothetical protein